MALTEKIKHLVEKSSALQSQDKDLLLPRDIFRKIIDRERDRANRTGEVFSLVVFILPDGKEKHDSLSLLTGALAQRVRSIDAAGWLDTQHVGILLPETDSAGAGMFANKIYQEILPLKLTLNYDIFTYPSNKLVDPEKAVLYVLSGKADPRQRRAFLWGEGRFADPERDVNYMYCLTRKVVKRGFDIVGASAFLLAFSHLFLFLAILIKAVSPGPVFYKQQRIGYGGKPFTFLKFRTMHPNAAAHNHQKHLAQLIKSEMNGSRAEIPMTKLDQDPQIIRFGNLMRKSCLDELPQLINVLRGEMSLVGPRPPIPYEVKEYLSWHRGRFDAIPGMTGLWQVSGKNKLSFREMVRLDIRYTRERSLWLDVKILFRTPLAIFVQARDSLKNKPSKIEQGV